MWSKLEVLYHIVKAGSLVNAAKVLKTDQPALSSKLATLEKKFGFKLINRSTPHRPLTLTEKGKIVFEVAQKNYLNVQMMEMSLYKKEGMKGKIRLSTTHAIADYIVNPLFIQFGMKYPDINLELIGNDTDIDILRNEVDIVICPYIDDDPTLVQEPLLTLEAGLYASPEYLKKFGEPKTAEELDDHRLIPFARPDDNPYAIVDWMLKVGREGKRKRRPFYTVNSVRSLFEAAEQGMGIIVSYDAMLKNHHPNLKRILKDTSSPAYQEYLIYPKKLEGVERIEKLRDYLKNELLTRK